MTTGPGRTEIPHRGDMRKHIGGLIIFPDDEFGWCVVDVVAVGCSVFCAVEEVWLGASGYVFSVGEAPLS